MPDADANRLIALNDGHKMPQLGLGLMRFGSQAETPDVVARALSVGYRLFDTAAVYGTEQETGAAFRQTAVPRTDLFVVTKLWNDSQGRDKARQAFSDSMTRLGLDYLDLYLIHWPLPMFDKFVETWRTLIELREEGRIRSIGVSNFTPEHIERLVAETGVAPAVNQVEMHPYFQQRELRACHARHAIVTQAWSPFGGGGSGNVVMQEDPVLVDIAGKRGCSPSQVILSWHLAQGVSVIPKATSLAHLRQNMAAVSVKLNQEDLERIEALDRADGRNGLDPLTMDITRAI